MRVLTSTLPAHGHWNPVVPFLRALVSAGHEVLVATAAQFCADVERAGLAPVAAGLDWHESHPEQAFDGFGESDDPRVHGIQLGRVMAGEGALRMVPDLERIASDWQPDVILATPAEPGAALLAELSTRPVAFARFMIPVGTWPGLVPLDREKRAEWRARSLLGLFNETRVQLGLPALETDEPVVAHRSLVLDMVPPSLHAWHAVSVTPVSHPMRPEIYHQRGPDPAWPSGDGPRILVAFGTVFHNERGALRDVVGGLAAVGRVLVSSPAPAAEIAAGRANVNVVPWVDYDRAAAECDLFVHHGGWGSMIAGFVHGVPMLAAPQGADQPPNAVRIRSVGAGRYLTRAHLTVEAVRAEAENILATPLYRMNSERIRDEIRAMPSPAERVKLLEQFVDGGGEPIEGERLMGPRVEPPDRPVAKVLA